MSENNDLKKEIVINWTTTEEMPVPTNLITEKDYLIYSGLYLIWLRAKERGAKKAIITLDENDFHVILT